MDSLEVQYMELFKKITPIQGLVLIVVIAVMLIAILLASQSYFSYIEVTEATNGCIERGGLPIIEKSGLRMTYFKCDIE